MSSFESGVRSVLRTVELVGYFVRFGTELLVKRPATQQARADWLHRFCARAMKGLGIAGERYWGVS